jgi:RNA polymerase primary sigma factor
MAYAASDSNLQIYLSQIHGTPLLTAQGEKDLARRIINDGDGEARDLMIRSNLRLVVAIAKRYVNRGLVLQDLIEEGNIGLVKAVESFDPDQGARFSTYGSWWIKQSIKRALINAVQPIHVPAYMVELITKWRRGFRELEDRHGRPPTLQEMAEHQGLPLKKARAVRNAAHAYQRSTQCPVGADGETYSLDEMVADTTTPTPEQTMLTAEQIASMRKLLDVIDERESLILRLRYGLDNQEPLTLRDIGLRIGLTRERVRQLEIEALRKMQGWLNSGATPPPRRARLPRPAAMRA